MPSCTWPLPTEKSVATRGAREFQHLLATARPCCMGLAMGQVRVSREATENNRSATQFMVIDPEESPHLYATLCYFTGQRDTHRADFGSTIPPHCGSTLDKSLESGFVHTLKFIKENDPPPPTWSPEPREAPRRRSQNTMWSQASLLWTKKEQSWAAAGNRPNYVIGPVMGPPGLERRSSPEL